MNKARVFALPDAPLPHLLEHMTALADPVRCRLLLLLERHELTVADCARCCSCPSRP